MGTGKLPDSKRDGKLSQWHDLIAESLRSNVSYKGFESRVLRLLLHSPLDGPGVLDAWVSAHDGGLSVRARLVKYFEQLLQLGLFAHAHVLQRVHATAPAAIFAADRFVIKHGAAKGEYRQCVEAVMLERMAYHLLTLRGSAGHTASDTVERSIDYRTIRPLMALIREYVQTTSSINMLEGPALSIGTELGKYVGVYINDLSVTGILVSEKGDAPKALKRAFGRLLPQLISLLSAGSNEVAQSLALLQQQSGLFENQDADAPRDELTDSLNSLTFQQSVIDAQPVTTRAALYVYLNAMLAARPICDDPSLFTFLNSRYNGAVDGLVVDLVTASFDVLANAINRTEPNEFINVYRSFLTNKVPVLLESFAHLLYPPITIESCITNAVRSMDPSTDPFGTQQGFDLLSSSGMLSEARQEFLFACALYGLIPESSIETILGDVPMQNLPESGKYDRSDLVAKCTANPSRIADLVNELENFEGQAAEITAALTQIIRDCSAGKDSITLKSICNTLSRKISALDVLLLFEEPKSLLQPLCELLDSWPDDEEHSEYHPVYDEFGSIFLLILVFRQRFDLQISDLGITIPDSFIRSYLQHGLMPRSPKDFSDAQRSQLAGWVKGLFDSDGNLSDEPMSTCGPKAFHLLVSTLFDQSLKANQAGLIPFSALQGGLSYFLEPFLLPSLVTGLGWAARRLWETPSNQTLASQHLDNLIPLLAALVRPASLSPEAKTLHESVIATVAGLLERALAHVQSLHPRRTDLEQVRAALAPRVPPLRTASLASPAELEGWASGTPGGFVPGLRLALRGLVAWSWQAQQAQQAAAAAAAAAGQQGTAAGTNPAVNPPSPPPQYTHRQVVQAVRIVGGPATLSTLLDEAMRLIDGMPAPAIIAGSNASNVQAAASNAAGGPTPGPSSGAAGPINSNPGSGPGNGGSSGSGGGMGVNAGANSSTRTYAASLVIDVLAAMIAAPVPTSPRALLTLRQSLTLAASDAYVMAQRDRPRAELVVKVDRRVASMCLSATHHPGDMQGLAGPRDAQNGADGTSTGADAGTEMMVGIQGSGTDAGGVDDILMAMGGHTAAAATAAPASTGFGTAPASTGFGTAPAAAGGLLAGDELGMMGGDGAEGMNFWE